MAVGPFLLEPSLAERVWGGRRLGEGIGEAWDLSVHANGPSVVRTGPDEGRPLAEVVDERPTDFGGPIDLLAKRLDCAQNLSVQVHPTTDDPKTEAWVVLDAEPGAGVYLGFDHEVEPAEVADRAVDGTLAGMLTFVEVAVGEAVFVPAGTVHAIGAGLVLFELQQSSDTTYRLFDWGREGRELHLEAGLACARLGPAPSPAPAVSLGSGVERLVASPYFVIDRLRAGPGGNRLTVDPGERWVAFFCVDGSARIGDVSLGAGDTALVPGAAGPCRLDGAPGFVALRYGPPPRTTADT